MLEPQSNSALPRSRTLATTSWATTGVLAIMVLLPVARVVVRRQGGDIPGATVLVQHLTLWTGFLGLILATVTQRNLSLSTVHLLPAGNAQMAARIFSNALSAAVAALLAYGSVRMIAATWHEPSALPGGVPLWVSELVMPVALTVVAGRSIWHAPGGWMGRFTAVAAIGLGFGVGLLGEAHTAAVVWPGLVAIALGFLLGTPVYAAMGGLAMLLTFAEGSPIVAVPNTAYQLVTNATLPAIPLLTVAGYVLAAGGASQRLAALGRALLGWLPGGMGLMALAVCAMFTALTGASGVTILAVGGVVLPTLREENYPERFSLGLVTAAGSLGLLFPPSLPVLLYSIKGEVDLKHLYLAGLVPGLIVIAVVGVYTIFVGMRSQAPRHPFGWREAGRALWAAKWDLGLPLVMIGSYALSLTTLLEAAALGALYAVLVETLVFRNVHPTRDLPAVLANAATLVGSVVVLMGVALALSEYLTLQGIPTALLDWITGHIHSTWGFLLALNVMLLVLGSVLEMYSAIILLAPLIVPLGQPYGVSATHLGVVFLANLELGFLLPPLGLNLFLSATRFGKPLPLLYRAALPFLALMTIGVLIVTYFPSVTIGVLRLLGIES